jgi:integrase
MIERFPLADLEAEAVTVFDLLAYRRERMVKKKGQKPTSEKGVRPDFVHLRAALKAARRAKLISAHVFEDLSDSETDTLFPVWRPTPEYSKGQVISEDDWRTILAVFPEEDFNRTLRFADATGCRKRQATALDWSAYRDMPVPGFTLVKQKKSVRFVAMTAAIRALVGERRASGWVFDKDGRLYGRLSSTWRYRVNKKLGMSYRIHDTRHTVGTALRESAGVENGASALGVTPGMMGIYGEHNKAARDAAVMDAMEKRREPVTNLSRSLPGAASESSK